MNLRSSSLLRQTLKNAGDRSVRGVTSGLSPTTPPREKHWYSSLLSDMDANGQSDKRQRVHCTVPNGTVRPQSVASRPTTVSGFVYLDHQLQVPLDHDDLSGKTITIFAREVRSSGCSAQVFEQSTQPISEPPQWCCR
jgi:hypothetical protein